MLASTIWATYLPTGNTSHAFPSCVAGSKISGNCVDIGSSPLLGGFGVGFAIDSRRRLRRQIRGECLVAEVLRHRHFGRQVVAVLGNKAWSCLEVQPALRSAVGA